MKTKLIYTKDYLLLIDEDTEIKEGVYIYEYSKCKGNKPLSLSICKDEDMWAINNSDLDSIIVKIIAYYPLTKEVKDLDLPLLPNPFKIKPTEQIVAEFCRNYENVNYNNIEDKVHLAFLQEDMVLLYDQAQSKQFSLKDMKKAIEMAREADSIDGTVDLHIVLNFPNSDISDLRIKWTEEEIIQSLSTQRLPKEFIPETEYVEEDCEPAGCDFPDRKEVLKTTINSEGKEELVGTYKY